MAVLPTLTTDHTSERRARGTWNPSRTRPETSLRLGSHTRRPPASQADDSPGLFPADKRNTLGAFRPANRRHGPKPLALISEGLQKIPCILHRFRDGASGTRTRHLLLAKQALSQLSYGPWTAQYTLVERGFGARAALPSIATASAPPRLTAASERLRPRLLPADMLPGRCGIRPSYVQLRWPQSPPRSRLPWRLRPPRPCTRPLAPTPRGYALRRGERRSGLRSPPERKLEESGTDKVYGLLAERYLWVSLVRDRESG